MGTRGCRLTYLHAGPRAGRRGTWGAERAGGHQAGSRRLEQAGARFRRQRPAAIFDGVSAPLDRHRLVALVFLLHALGHNSEKLGAVALGVFATDFAARAALEAQVIVPAGGKVTQALIPVSSRKNVAAAWGVIPRASKDSRISL